MNVLVDKRDRNNTEQVVLKLNKLHRSNTATQKSALQTMHLKI